jgi:hypothetical protein
MPLLSARRQTTTLAPPLPVANTIFASAGLVFRQGQFSILAAAPGVGKTVVATNLCIRTPVPAIYFSADSDEWTVKQRACSILSGVELTEVETRLGDDAWDDHYTDMLRKADHVDWCFQSDIDTDFIVTRLQAYAELRGDYPRLIVVDNLGNTVVDQDNEGSELRATCRELQRIARNTGAHVMALHHVAGAKENGLQPILLGDLLYKIGKIPEQVLGLYWAGGEQYASPTMTAPKYRGGKGGLTIPLGIDYTKATVGGFHA